MGDNGEELGMSGGVIDNILCNSYGNSTPTFALLTKNPPPEYFPLLVIGLLILLGNILLTGWEIRRHCAYLKGPTFLLALRTMMILSAYAVFAWTSCVGIISIRSSKFLHFIANAFEAFCILAFFENMIAHLRVRGFFEEGGGMPTATPPCCCCCFKCLPPLPSTKKSIVRLRLMIFQMILVQVVMEMLKIINVFECRFDPEAIQTRIFDFLTLASFMVAMWALVIVYRAERGRLAEFLYFQKFGAFKLMIAISTFLYTVLAFIASLGYIDGHYVDGHLVLDGKSRVSIWTNFITITISTLLLVLSIRLYSDADYAVLVSHDKHVVSRDEHEVPLDKYEVSHDKHVAKNHGVDVWEEEGL